MTIPLHEIATEAESYFESRKRGEETIIVTKDDAPDWVTDLCHDAHGDMMPDDWRYDAIHSAVSLIAESGADDESDLEDRDHEFADGQVDIYTSDRLRWLASNLDRTAYVDEARSEFGGEDSDVTEQIGMGQYMEASEIWGSVVRSLVSEQESREDDDE